jgi:hypothetical protein
MQTCNTSAGGQVIGRERDLVWAMTFQRRPKRLSRDADVQATEGWAGHQSECDIVKLAHIRGPSPSDVQRKKTRAEVIGTRLCDVLSRRATEVYGMPELVNVEENEESLFREGTSSWTREVSRRGYS